MDTVHEKGKAFFVDLLSLSLIFFVLQLLDLVETLVKILVLLKHVKVAKINSENRSDNHDVFWNFERVYQKGANYTHKRESIQLVLEVILENIPVIFFLISIVSLSITVEKITIFFKTLSLVIEDLFLREL